MTQTSIPMESFWNKKQVAIPLTIIVGILIMGGLYLLGGETRAMPQQDFKPQLAQWQAEYEASVKKEEMAKMAKCEKERQGAALKILANGADPENFGLTMHEMNNLMIKRDKDCSGRYSLIPSAKALSFEEFPGKDVLGKPLIHAGNFEEPEIGLNKATASGLDLDKLAYAVSIAETSGCTKGTGRSKNNCFGIMAWTSGGVRYARTFATKEESFEEFKRIWAKSYGRFPTLAMAKKWTGNDQPHTWLATVTQKYNQ